MVELPLKEFGRPRIVSLDSWDTEGGKGHFALHFSTGESPRVPEVRIHSECVTGDVLGSLRCDCGEQLRESLGRLQISGGILIYLRQEGRGIGLAEKLKAYALQDKGLDTFEANRRLGHQEDERSYEVAAHYLKSISVHTVKLITRNTDKVDQLRRYGVKVDRVIGTGRYVTEYNEKYLAAKESRLAGQMPDLWGLSTPQLEGDYGSP